MKIEGPNGHVCVISNNSIEFFESNTLVFQRRNTRKVIPFVISQLATLKVRFPESEELESFVYTVADTLGITKSAILNKMRDFEGVIEDEDEEEFYVPEEEETYVDSGTSVEVNISPPKEYNRYTVPVLGSDPYTLKETYNSFESHNPKTISDRVYNAYVNTSIEEIKKQEEKDKQMQLLREELERDFIKNFKVRVK